MTKVHRRAHSWRIKIVLKTVHFVGLLGSCETQQPQGKMTMMEWVVTLLLSLTVIVGVVANDGRQQEVARHAFLSAARQGSVAISTPKLRDNELQRRARRNSNNRNLFPNARQLSNYYYNNNNNNNQNNNNNNNNANQNSKESIDWSTIGFDITQYSVRYMGCSSVLSYSDELAKSDATTVLQAHRYAVFRLCPSFYCNPYSLTGCDSDYGEYAVDLDTYLQAIATYDDEVITTYCEYCSVCNVTNSTYNGNTCNSSACKNATGVCAKSSATYSASEYFSCTAVVSKTDGKTYYLGPHCGGDSYSISVDVYSDSYCTNYVGNKVTVSDVLDGTLNQNSLDYLPKKCVTCKESTNPWQVVASDSSESDGVSEICEVLYEDSARCNENLGHDTATSTYGVRS
jgi:hypothetical protein